MTLAMNGDLARRELSVSELETISAGLIPGFLGPPVPAPGHCQPPHCSPHPRYFPGGSPNDPALHPHH